MTHVLEAGFEEMEVENPNGSPAIRGYNIIAGKLSQSSDGSTFLSRKVIRIEQEVK